MKKAFISYILLTSIVLVGLTSATIGMTITHRDTQLTNPEKIHEPSNILLDATSFKVAEKALTQLQLSNDIRLTKIQALDFSNFFTDTIVAVGSIKNSTNHKNGLIQIYSCSINQTLGINSEVLFEYQDESEQLESDYFSVSAITGNLTGSGNLITIIALEEIGESQFEIDIFSLSQNSLEIIMSYELPSQYLSLPYQITTLDSNQDGLRELYLLGKNETTHSLLCFNFNTTSSTFYYEDSISWSASQKELITMKVIQTTELIEFIITGVDSSSGLKTYLKRVALMPSSHEFNYTQATFNFPITLPEGSFRVYSMELSHDSGSNTHKIVLFGAYFYGSSMFPASIVVSYSSDNFNYSDIVINEEKAMSWSASGLIADIDLDGTEEILVTSYDPLESEASSLGTITHSNSNVELVSNELTNIMNIKSSAKLFSNNHQLACWLGKTLTGIPVIEFFQLEHFPFIFKSDAAILPEEDDFYFSLEPTTLSGQAIYRDDFRSTISLEHHPTKTVTITSASDSNHFSIPSLNNSDSFSERINVKIERNNTQLATYQIQIQIVSPPKISLSIPHSPLVLRAPDYEVEPLTMKIQNSMIVPMNANISIETTRASSIQNYYEVLEPFTTNYFDYFLDTEIYSDGNSYSEEIIVEITSNAGTHQFQHELVITSEFRILPNDLLITLLVVLGLTILGYITFAFVIYQNNRQTIYQQTKDAVPLNLELPLFKRQAIDSLLYKFLNERNWKLGLRLSENYDSEVTLSFLKMKAQDELKIGQVQANKDSFTGALDHWLIAQEAIERIGNQQWLDMLDWLLDPLSNIIEIKKTMKGSEKAAALLKEFQRLNALDKQQIQILGIDLSLPLYLIAEELGLAYKEAEELQSSLNYLQLAYQWAPDEEKNRIVTEITDLIRLGAIPAEPRLDPKQKEIQKKLQKRKVRCFACGIERENIHEKCPNCASEPVLCSVCKLPISYGADWVECPHCTHKAHKEHLQEWVKVKGTCPVCKQKLLVDDLVSSDAN
ncbi:MAG: hypothetical protein GF308_05595 [Candidatus Heimdallarchaeota archaeon]|nr:hypothetical protein [Candidatus Heimdallarchaeota archaeon]